MTVRMNLNDFSIHALLAESDCNHSRGTCRPNFSIHALLAESDSFATGLSTKSISFSIHALLAESDAGNKAGAESFNFLSTLSLRRATGYRRRLDQPCSLFYPRSPCGERPNTSIIILDEYLFYPRSPCGERLSTNNHIRIRESFLSTLSLRRAT